MILEQKLELRMEVAYDDIRDVTISRATQINRINDEWPPERDAEYLGIDLTDCLEMMHIELVGPYKVTIERIPV